MKNNNMFVAAGVQTIMDTLVKTFSSQDFNSFMREVCPKGLVSFGANLTKQNKNKKFKEESHIKGVVNLIKSYKDIKDTMDLFIDSGGYQITTGLVPRKNIEQFISAYTHFLNEYKDMYDAAFSLDIPVLPDKTTEEEMIDLNIKAYNLIDDLSEDIKDRLIFVSHFRLVELYRIWNHLIFDLEILKKYKKFSIGGLVASQPATKKMYFDLYTLGILQIILGLDKNIPDPFYFHILGSATSTNIIYFCLLENHIEQLFNKKCYLTFDSSAVFTKVQIGRTFTYFNDSDKCCYNIDLRSSELHIPDSRCKKSPHDIVFEICEEIKQKSKINYDYGDKIYTSENGTFTPEIRPFIFGLECYTLNKISNYCRNLTKEYLYPLYLKDEQKFYLELENLFVRFNGNKISHTSSSKISSIKSSLDTIKDFVENKNKKDLFNLFQNLSGVLDTQEINDMTNQFNLFGD